MATSAAIICDLPVSAGSTTVTALIGQPVSSISHVLSTLQSFLVSTLGWTLLDTAVSGLAENFVVRSSGTSGDRLICLKFGASLATQTTSGLSCFACVSFASATDVASNATTEQSLALNGTGDLRLWLVGDRDHIMIGTDRPQAAASSCWLYAGLTDEFSSNVTQTPNQTVIGVTHSIEGILANARIVESPTATFNVALQLRSPLGATGWNAAFGGGPDRNDGYVYLWPCVVVNTAADRVYGFLKNAMQLSRGISAGALLCGVSATYAAFGGIGTTGTATASVAMRVG